MQQIFGNLLGTLRPMSLARPCASHLRAPRTSTCVARVCAESMRHKITPVLQFVALIGKAMHVLCTVPGTMHRTCIALPIKATNCKTGVMLCRVDSAQTLATRVLVVPNQCRRPAHMQGERDNKLFAAAVVVMLCKVITERRRTRGTLSPATVLAAG